MASKKMVKDERPDGKCRLLPTFFFTFRLKNGRENKQLLSSRRTTMKVHKHKRLGSSTTTRMATASRRHSLQQQLKQQHKAKSLVGHKNKYRKNNNNKSKPVGSLYGHGQGQLQRWTSSPFPLGETFASACRRTLYGRARNLKKAKRRASASASTTDDNDTSRYISHLLKVSSKRTCMTQDEHQDENASVRNHLNGSDQTHKQKQQPQDAPQVAPRPPLPSKGSVCFTTIEIREYARQLGDNPSVSAGPPVTLCWTPHTSFCLSVEEYEQERFCQRREARYLVLPLEQRQWLVSNSGYTKEEMQQVMQELFLAKMRRHETRMEVRMSSAGEKGEGWGVWKRRWRPLFGGSGSASSRGSQPSAHKRRMERNGTMLAEARARRAVTTAGQA